MRIIHHLNFSDEEREIYKNLVYENTYSCMKIILEAGINLKINVKNKKLRVCMIFILKKFIKIRVLLKKLLKVNMNGKELLLYRLQLIFQYYGLIVESKKCIKNDLNINFLIVRNSVLNY